LLRWLLGIKQMADIVETILVTATMPVCIASISMKCFGGPSQTRSNPVSPTVRLAVLPTRMRDGRIESQGHVATSSHSFGSRVPFRKYNCFDIQVFGFLPGTRQLSVLKK
jgi:hypothetical protein